MKKLLIFLAVLLCSLAFAEKAEIKFIAEDGSATSVFFEKDETCIVIDAKKFPTKKLVSITGFENFPNLDSLTFYFLRQPVDYDFLAKIPKLRDLGLVSCRISSLKFLENIPNLETATINFSTDLSNYNTIKNTEINLKKLKNLKKLYFDSSSFSNDGKAVFLDFILPLTNIRSKPTISLTNNKIATLTKKEIKLLRQYSNVILNQNPIVDKKQELQNLKKAKINFEADYYVKFD